MEKNIDVYEREGDVRSSTRKRRISHTMVSDDESSTDKSNKTRTKPPSGYWRRRIVVSVSAEYEDEDDDYPPKPAQSEPSIGKPQSEYEASSDDDYDLSRPNHHKSLNFDDEDEFSNLGAPIHNTADQSVKIEKSMAESDYGFATPNHLETPRQTLGSEKQISNSMAGKGKGMGENQNQNQNPWIAECDHGCSAQPLIRAAWVGSFTVNGDWGKVSETFEGLQGYVSSKACPMVRLVAEKLPEAIRWEKLPKCCVWPKGFQRQGGPTDDDIAVFFFPSLAKHESEYDSFVFDLIRGDFAMRATVMGSELLVFTSVDLPQVFTRFQGKLYLWGVFKGNQPRPLKFN